MRKLVALFLCLLGTPALAQSDPGFVKGQVPTAAQWNSYFAGKLDYNGGNIIPASIATTGSATIGTSLAVGTTFSAAGAAALSSTLAVTGAATFGSTLAATGAITASAAFNCNGVGSNCGPVIYVKCKNNSTDVAAINTAINTAHTAATTTGGVAGVRLSAGTCLAGVTAITPSTNVWVSGAGMGATTLAVASAFTTHAIIDTAGRGALTNVWFSDFTIDMGDFTDTGTYGFQLNNITNMAIRRVEVKNMGQFGVVVGSNTNYWIEDNILSRTTAAASQNEAILVVDSSTSINGHINRNLLTNTGIDLSSGNTEMVGNIINGLGFGAGISTVQSTKCYNLNITNNVIYGGTGVDVNGFTVGGIENWCPHSNIAYNVIYNNAGSGITHGGQYNNVIGNVTYDNGQYNPGQFSGISARYGTSTYNGSNSVVVGNQSFNTAGAGGPQKYGYEETSSSLANIQLVNNNFSTNGTGTVNLMSSTTNGFTSAAGVLAAIGAFQAGGAITAASGFVSGANVGVDCSVGTLNPTTAIVSKGIITHC